MDHLLSILTSHLLSFLFKLSSFCYYMCTYILGYCIQIKVYTDSLEHRHIPEAKNFSVLMGFLSEPCTEWYSVEQRKNEELKGMVKYLISENLMLNFYKLMFHRIRFLLTVMNIEYEGTTKNWLTQIKQKQMFHHHFICHIRIVRYQTQTPSICGNKLNRMHSNWILNDGRDNRSRTFILYGTMFRMVFQRFVVGIRC